ncbi:polyprenyl synthetase family protein [Psittacicella gerlachiana]|uniref:Geranylgeranyl diphosphate synthase type II n=1 Tax=Psittacicella gerlachiana TaxID=2028574 RepID=A0A3A1YGB1_9GAMM|nr:polyprenyl synthetase family protein [Psittacicella gerlachiana]RIY36715.1 hypothetical protein CKF59_02605 [Psittacicella gerlachiana]
MLQLSQEEAIKYNLNELADLIVSHYNLEQKLSEKLTLEEFLALISQATRNFIELVLGVNSDSLQQLFFNDPQILDLLPPNAQDQQIMQIFGMDKLRESMYYSLYSDGKMLRPALVFVGGLLTKAKLSDLLIAAMAIECIHTYSLIHDDLPAMDNDTYRRGKLTNHLVFGESMAILAGDALQTLGFSLLSSNQQLEAKQVLKQVQVLAYGAGHYGMCLGQALDILGDDLTLDKLKELGISQSKAELRLTQIHYRKTAFLIRSSILLGVYASNHAKGKDLERILSYWAYNLGLTFQIKDDILDVLGNEAEIGKPVGSDLVNHKLTYVSLYGLEQAQEKLNAKFVQTLEYVEQLENLFKENTEQEASLAITWLRDLTTFVVNRNK